MDVVKSATRLVEREYGLMRLPEIYDPGFLALIRGSRHLGKMVTSLLGSPPPLSMSIIFGEGVTASTDSRTNVRVPAWYCVPEALEKFVGRPLSNKEASAISLTLVNGSTIHESLHVARSKYLFGNAAIATLSRYADRNLAEHLSQILEDLKNETIIENHKGGEAFFEFVNAKNEIFFSSESLNEAVEAEFKRTESWKDAALEALVFYKCKGRRDEVDALLEKAGVSAAIPLMHEACSLKADVLTLVGKLYEIFKRDDGKPSKDTSERYEGKKTEEAAQTAQEVTTEEERDDIEAEINQTDGAVPPVKEADILSENWGGRKTPIHKTALSFGFVRKLKIARQVVPSHDEPRKSGAKLLPHRLARIVTDGKVFTRHGESMSSMQKKQPTYVLLGDFSGSMRPIFDMVLSVLFQISKEMKEADIPHSVYGHTSIMSESGTDTPTLYHVFSHRMMGVSNGQHTTRFEKAGEVSLSQNYDGIIIDLLAKKHRKQSNVVLIVLSDGTPSGSNYMDGDGHTMEAITRARKSGMKVISMSLTQTVIPKNDKFYGAKFNVDATSQSKLETQLRKLIMG